MRKEQEKEAKELEKRQKEEAKQAEQERKRQEKEKKLEEKERKQEEKERKQEEKDRKIEEKRKKEEAEKAKTEKIAKSFTSFFIKKETTQTPSMDESCEDEENTSCFTRFRIKKDMRLAPVLRRGDDFDPSTLDDKINWWVVRFDNWWSSYYAAFFSDAKSDHLYLAAIKRRDYKPGHQGKTWPVEEIKKDSDNEVEVLEEDEDDEDLPEGTAMAVDLPDMESASAPRAKYRVKLLQFCENQRPAYFGTWMKQSKFVGPRKPFGRDSEFFDYDYDSDDDWEEEEQGESLSDEEKDKEEDERDNDVRTKMDSTIIAISTVLPLLGRRRRGRWFLCRSWSAGQRRADDAEQGLWRRRRGRHEQGSIEYWLFWRGTWRKEAGT